MSFEDHDNFLDLCDDEIDNLLLGCDIVKKVEHTFNTCISCKSENLMFEFHFVRHVLRE